MLVTALVSPLYSFSKADKLSLKTSRSDEMTLVFIRYSSSLVE